MRKLYATLILTLTLSYSFTQGIEIYVSGSTTDISGTTVYSSWQDPSMKKILDVKNVSGFSKNLAIKRLKIVEVAGATDYLCWGISLAAGEGLCYPASEVAPNNPWTSPDSYTFAPDAQGLLWVYHSPDGNYGQTRYRYYILENGVALDSVDVVNNYFLSTPEQKPASFSVYPNPANNVLTVSVENLDNSSSITIFDISGKTVLTSSVNNGKTQLDIKNLDAGVYFYKIRNNNNIVETKKIVII